MLITVEFPVRFKTWFAHLAQFAASSNHSNLRRSRFRPLIEALEDRTVPATITVTGTGEGGGTYEVIPTGPNSFSIGDLRDALDYASSLPGPDTILFAANIAGQTIHLTQDDTFYPTDMGHTALVINPVNNITIKGDPTRGMTIDAGGARRHFGVGLGGTLTLENLTLTNGLAQGGAGANAGGSTGSGAPGGGGAGLGGAIYADQGVLNLINCTFTGNTALGGSGGSLLNGSNSGGGGGGSAAFDGGLPGNNGGGGGGAGMYGPGLNGNGINGGKGGLNQKGQQAGANDTGSNGGGGGGGNYSTTIGINVAHSGGPANGANSFGFGGGGGGGAVTSANSSYGDAHGGAGGFGAGGGGAGWPGVSASGGAGGFGGGGGGGIGINNGGVSAFGGGTGGAVYAGLYVPGWTTSGGGGAGAGLGGAIFVNSGSISIQNCTITNNTANGGTGGQGATDYTSNGNDGNGLGGAIFVRNGTLSQVGCTINGNNASGGGAQVYLLSQGNGQTAKATLVNSVIGQSGPSTGADVIFKAIQGGATPQITGFKNFVSTPGQFPKSALAGTGDPKLLPLADNGGPTMTMLPQADSPLIDAGYNGLRGRILKDQRGLNRFINAFMDIGSVEVDVAKPPFLRDTAIRYGLLNTEFLLTFSGPVKVSAGAFQLYKQGDGTPQVVSVRAETVNGYTVVHLLASRQLYMRRQPLTLTVDGTLITDKNGVALPELTQQIALNF